ncbi:MAG: hypothetical protein NZ953_03305 [Thaumarchaeota archaeon]|nr:hypothetical protein [Candidatus Calditenuaceae archaeon]
MEAFGPQRRAPRSLRNDSRVHRRRPPLTRASLVRPLFGGQPRLAISPTATISITAGTTPDPDPYLSNLLSGRKLSGKFFECNGYLVRGLKEAGVWEEVMEELVER